MSTTDVQRASCILTGAVSHINLRAVWLQYYVAQVAWNTNDMQLT